MKHTEKTMQKHSVKDIVKSLKEQRNDANIAGMARFGISAHNTLGVSMPVLRSMAKDIGKDHALAIELWSTGIHEARILAGLVADPLMLSEKVMEQWVRQFDSWDVCDQVCSNLFDKTSFALAKAQAWSRRDEEFIKRAGFVLMATLSVHDKSAEDDLFVQFFPRIIAGAADERNFVKKAVNWALRQIGKRNIRLNKKAITVAEELAGSKGKAARWIGKDALRELTGKAVKDRLCKQSK